MSLSMSQTADVHTQSTPSTGLRRERIASSPNFKDGRAVNLPTSPLPTPPSGPTLDTTWRFFTERGERVPNVEIPVERLEAARLQPETHRDLRVTRFGHSTVMIEIDGHLILTDPVFSQRVSPIRWAGPKRFHPAPLSADTLPLPDVVLLSHDHYDHLDAPTIVTLAKRGASFIAPLGVGGHLERWGVSPERITELDWWERTSLGELELVCTPSHHFSGRGLDSNRTLWSSWAILGPHHKVWFSGDTGPLDALSEIGDRLGPFDLTMIEIGAWDASWGDIHLGPDNAARVHAQVQGELMLPIHWGTFNLALHAWHQPIARMQQVAVEQGIDLLVPRFGDVVHAEPWIDGFWSQFAA